MFIFEVKAKSDGIIKLTKERFLHIILKHLEMADREEGMQNALLDPIPIKESFYDSNTWLYYRPQDTNEYIAVVAKIQNDKGFVITAYITQKIKEGKIIWKKS